VDSRGEELRTIAETHGLLVSRLARRMILDRAVAEEAAQEVWCEIARSLPAFRGEAQLSTWIYTVARRTLLRCARKERVLREREVVEFMERGPIAYAGPEAEKLLWVKEQCDRCLTAFCHCLSGEARLILLFREVAELPFPQIAEVMEISDENARQVHARSWKKVRRFMERDCFLFNPQGRCRCRIQHHLREIDTRHVWSGLREAMELVDFYREFDRELPRRSYWEEIVGSVVTP
jgi:RNA polymerase sigma factor (sigma-70 family)